MDTSQILVPSLQCSNLTVRYGTHEIVRDLSFHLGQGEVFAILGRSGSGKTTVLKALNVLLRPERGVLQLGSQVYFRDGASIFELNEVRTRIGMVFQGLNLFPNLTALQNITLALMQVKGLSIEEADRRALTLSAQLGVDRLVHRYPESLSGGEAQRIALARALAMEPSVLLLDEVTSALDPEAVQMVCRSLLELKRLREEPVLSMILVTHNVHFALRFADRIAFLHDGKLVDVLPAGRFMADAANPATRSYLHDLADVGAAP